MSRLAPTPALLLAATLFAAPAAHAQFTDAVSDGDWLEPSIWTQGVPTSLSNAGLMANVALDDGLAEASEVRVDTGAGAFAISGGALDVTFALRVGAFADDGTLDLTGGSVQARDVAVGYDAAVGRLTVSGGTLTATDDLVVGAENFPQAGEIGTFTVVGASAGVTAGGSLVVSENGVLELRPSGPGALGLSPIVCEDIDFRSGALFPAGSGSGTATLRLDTTDYLPLCGESFLVAQYGGTLTGVPVLDAPDGVVFELDTSVPGELSILVTAAAFPGPASSNTLASGDLLDPALWSDGLPGSETNANVSNGNLMTLDDGCGYADRLYLDGGQVSLAGGMLMASKVDPGPGSTLTIDGGTVQCESITVHAFSHETPGEVRLSEGVVDASSRVQVGLASGGGFVGDFRMLSGDATLTTKNFEVLGLGTLVVEPSDGDLYGLPTISTERFVLEGTLVLDDSSYAICPGDSWVLAQYTDLANVSQFATLVGPAGLELEVEVTASEVILHVIPEGLATSDTQAVADGDWFAPGTWDVGVPGAAVMATINGHAVSLDDAGCVAPVKQLRLLGTGELAISAGELDATNWVRVWGQQLTLTGGAIRSSKIEVAQDSSVEARFEVSAGVVETDEIALFTATMDVQGGLSTISTADLNLGEGAVLEFTPTGPAPADLTAIQCGDINITIGGFDIAWIKLDTSAYLPCVGDSWVIANYTGTLQNPQLAGFVNDPGVKFTLDTSVPGELRMVVTKSPIGSTSFVDLGHALPGTSTPSLVGGGALVADCQVTLTLDSALPLAPSFLVLGLGEIEVPFKGGVMVPAPDLVLALPTDADGDVPIAFTWPQDIPAGVRFFTQFWLPDVAGPKGYSASNALELIAQ